QSEDGIRAFHVTGAQTCALPISFPTTPNSYAPTKPNNNCNLGAIKIDFEQTVRAMANIDPTLGFDTICDTLIVDFTNTSLHANKIGRASCREETKIEDVDE